MGENRYAGTQSKSIVKKLVRYVTDMSQGCLNISLASNISFYDSCPTFQWIIRRQTQPSKFASIFALDNMPHFPDEPLTPNHSEELVGFGSS